MSVNNLHLKLMTLTASLRSPLYFSFCKWYNKRW